MHNIYLGAQQKPKDQNDLQFRMEGVVFNISK